MKQIASIWLLLVMAGPVFAAAENSSAAEHRQDQGHHERSVPEPALLVLLGVGGTVAYGIRRSRIARRVFDRTSKVDATQPNRVP
jgi:hypothetical protein